MLATENETEMADGISGARGTTYESRMCMLFALRGYTRGLANFRLRYQVPESEVGKFNDILIDEGGENYQAFQLKLKENRERNKISGIQLFNEKLNTDFNLLRYVKSVIDINSNKTLKGKVRTTVVYTNIDFDLQYESNKLSLVSNRNDWCKEITDIELHSFTPDESAIFDTSNSFPDAKYYKFDNDPKIVQILKRQAETLSQELRLTLQKRQKTANEKRNERYVNQQNKMYAKNQADANALEQLTENDIREALKYIVYAVRQPNDEELVQLMKDEIKDYFKLQVAERVYNAFEYAMTKWCNTKEPLVYEVPTTNPYVIHFSDVKMFFQQHVKKVSFGYDSPSLSFTGRQYELNRIRETLEKNTDLIVSQSILISGLGGSGKTELVRQYIKMFGQSDFCGRVICIDAESNESVKKSFKALAEMLDIPDRENKSIKTIIDQIFDYFHGLKVLFVFDNFDKNTQNEVEYSDNREENLVIYCQKKACDQTMKHRPYFICTTRNRECFPNMLTLDLGGLIKEDANELVKRALIARNYTNEDVEELAKTLQYFPLALKQATSYINRQHEIKSVFGKWYVIQDYLTEFFETPEKLLNYPHYNDFGEYERTTLITWNVTFDAISKDKINGPNAIKILHLMSYLNAAKIDAKMFLPLFENDLMRTGQAFLLLEKYSIITRIRESTFYQIHRLIQKVVRLIFKEDEPHILEQAWKLINPELYESYFDDEQLMIEMSKLFDQCTTEQVLYYNSLATYIKNYKELNIKFQKFLCTINIRVLKTAALKDDVENITKLNLPQNALKEVAVRHYSSIIKSHSNKVFKYFIEKKYLELNYGSILDDIIRHRNLDLFKYMVEQNANLKGLMLVSTDLINDIKQGNIDSLKSSFNSHIEKKENTILKEGLFFASLFNQKDIVEFLINKKVEPNFTFCEQEGAQKPLLFSPIEGKRIFYGPITAAATLRYPNILKILLKPFDKPELDRYGEAPPWTPMDLLLELKKNVKKILDELLDEKYFSDKNCFEIVFKKYLELGGNINDKHDYKCEWQSTFLCYLTNYWRFDVVKIEIAHFLVDNGADPCLMNVDGKNALFNVLTKINDSLYYLCDAARSRALYIDIYKKMRSKISTEEFMTSIRKCLFKRTLFGDNVKISDFLFLEIDDINLRNKKKETLLINVVREFGKSDDDETEYNGDDKTNTHKSMVEFLCDEGVDVEAIDNDGNNALYYALDLESSDIFMFLFAKVHSVSENILFKAIKEDRLSCIEELLKAHFDLNHTFENGKTCLEVAFENLSLKTMLLLHRKIQEINLEDGEVQRIYEIADMALIKYIKTCVKDGDCVDYEDLKAFLEISADINAIDSDGNNALYYAQYLEDDNATHKFLLSSMLSNMTINY